MLSFLTRRSRPTPAREWQRSASSLLLGLDEFRMRHCIVRDEWSVPEHLAYLHWALRSATMALRLGSRTTDTLLDELYHEALAWRPAPSDPAASIVAGLGIQAETLDVRLAEILMSRAAEYDIASEADRDGHHANLAASSAARSRVCELFTRRSCRSDLALLLCERADRELEGLLDAARRRARQALMRD